MERSKICLTLTGSTLEEDIALVNKYRDKIDIVELRCDYLDRSEQLAVRKFPGIVGVPTILTIRRKCDGGLYDGGESGRTIIFSKALAMASPDPKNNFAYIDFEEDYHVSSLQDAALAFGTKIIRSYHDMEKPVTGLAKRMEELSRNNFEIPKIAFMPKTLDDVTQLFREAKNLKDNNHILIAMGPLGLPSRILSTKLGNYLTYCSAEETIHNTNGIFHITPNELNDLYHFKKIDENTKIFGITGWPLTHTSSPQIHNAGYEKTGLNAVYIPVKAEKIREALTFANEVGMEGLSVTVPHKENLLTYVADQDETVRDIGAANTIVKKDEHWRAYNTDAPGFERSLLEFIGKKNLRGKKVAIIGAGGAAKAVCYAVKHLKGKACVFNRTVTKAKSLADKYGFKFAPLNTTSSHLLQKYSDIIIQTTSIGMNATLPVTAENDPLYFYDFNGHETVIDIVYTPATTPLMVHAQQAGCRTLNGFNMLKYQGYLQFKHFTGISLEGETK